MRASDVLDQFEKMLADAGVSRDSPTAEDVVRAWSVMRQFADTPVDTAAPVEEDGDGILAQYGPYTDGMFDVDMTRQWTFYDDDGDYGGMTQLHCTFSFPITDETRSIGSHNLWSFDRDLDGFFAEALATPGFQVRGTPSKLTVRYSPV
jgi:hypothetical protein